MQVRTKEIKVVSLSISSILPGGDLTSAFLNRMIKNLIPRDIKKEVMEQVLISVLITERYSAGRRFLAGWRVERGIYRH